MGHASQTHCKRGHEFTPETTYRRPGTAHRSCRMCRGTKPFVALSVEERFWANVETDGPVPAHRPELGPCWIWTGRPHVSGYGYLHVVGGARRSNRLAYELLIGPIPEGLVVDHLCHNGDSSCPSGYQCRHRLCVNPAHLEAVLNRVNILRGNNNAAKNAARTHCIYGHEFTADNTLVSDEGRKRKCRTCATTRPWRSSVVPPATRSGRSARTKKAAVSGN